MYFALVLLFIYKLTTISPANVQKETEDYREERSPGGGVMGRVFFINIWAAILASRTPGVVARSTPARRVALCLCGQLRGHVRDGYAAFIARRVVPRWQVDVFVDSSTSTTLSSSPHELRNLTAQLNWQAPGAANITALEENVAGLVHAYGASLASLRIDRTPLNESRTLDGVTMPEPVLLHQPTNYRSTLPMLHHMERCNNARREFERSHGFVFDAVIMSRPDKYVWDNCEGRGDVSKSFVEAVEDAAANRTAFFQFHGGRNGKGTTSDKFAVGTSDAMDVFMSAFEHIAALWAKGVITAQEKLLHEYMADAISHDPRARTIDLARGVHPCGDFQRGPK